MSDLALKLAQSRLDAAVARAAWAWPRQLDLAALAQREPEPPRFIVRDWLPAGYATLLAGHGGIGKSGIALLLAVCIAAGLPFFGLPCERRRVLYLSCEDREEVLHWRLSRICAFLDLDLASLSGRLDVLDLVGADTVLMERSMDGLGFTAAFATLEERIKEYGTELLIIDGVSDTFGGNENARAEVKRFVNALVGLIQADRGGVLLVGHVSKPSSTAGASGEGYSGTTGWHNTVRARWYLYPENDADEGERTGTLMLELQKSNHGRIDQQIRFKWNEDAHLFIGEEVAGITAFDRKHRDREEERGVLAALAGCEVANIIVPTASTGQRTAYNVLSQRPEFPNSLRGAVGKRRFWRQIEALRQRHLLEEVSYRRANRHVAAKFALTSVEKRQCAECI